MATDNEKEFDIISIGDFVMDCISYVDRMPKMGETMKANNLIVSPGGKGANVCVASSRLGSRCAFVCKIGDDMFGENVFKILNKEKINTDNVTISEKSPTSAATIMVDNDGHNAIAVNFGATLDLNESDLDRAEEAIKKSKVLISSMMVTERNALYALKLAKKHNLISVFNFAPAVTDLSPEFNKYVDLLIVNDVEAEAFTGSIIKTIDDAKEACKLVIAREGFSIGVVVTLGEHGCVFGNKKTGDIRHFPCKKVKVVDSTGAGDAFVGSLSHYISCLGLENIYQAIELAGEYASLSVQAKGTQASYPYLNDIDEKFKIKKNL